MHRRRLLRLGGTALAAGVAGCGSSGSDGARVGMTDGFTFEPRQVTVQSGATVTWDNEGDVDHTVTAYGDRIPDDAAYFASGGFDSESLARANLGDGLIEGGESYSHTFEVTGTYDYFCVPHEGSGMKGQVRVK
jgi:plastocyanin